MTRSFRLRALFLLILLMAGPMTGADVAAADPLAVSALGFVEPEGGRLSQKKGTDHVFLE